jgi:hypothetical protein
LDIAEVNEELFEDTDSSLDGSNCNGDGEFVISSDNKIVRML